MSDFVPIRLRFYPHGVGTCRCEVWYGKFCGPIGYGTKPAFALKEAIFEARRTRKGRKEAVRSYRK